MLGFWLASLDFLAQNKKTDAHTDLATSDGGYAALSLLFWPSSICDRKSLASKNISNTMWFVRAQSSNTIGSLL